MSESMIMKRLMSKTTTIDDFNFDNMVAPPLLSFITLEDINYFHKLATSIRYSSNINFKYKEIDKIMRARGFVLLSRGTNRVVYRCLENQSIVLKIAIDDVGVKDNPREFKNQIYLKPFVCKIFEVSPCGTVAVVERVNNVKNREEFLSIAEDVYDLLCNWILGKYVLDDIGARKFLNYGIRDGFGPVLLDYPYMYELDGNKLYCQQDINGSICNGTIDYDDTFDNLCCSKCGRSYLAIELEKEIKKENILQRGKVDLKMKITIKRGNRTVKTSDSTKESRKITKRERIYNSLPEMSDIVFNVKVSGGSKNKTEVAKAVDEALTDFNNAPSAKSDKVTEEPSKVKITRDHRSHYKEQEDEFDTHTDFIPKNKETSDSEEEFDESTMNNVNIIANNIEKQLTTLNEKLEDEESLEEDESSYKEDEDNINENVDEEEDDEDQNFSNIPVGAAPPSKRSRRFDPDFYK